MAQSGINIEMRTVKWVWLAIKLNCWIKSIWILRMLNKSIFARIYVNGKLSQELILKIDLERKMLKIDVNYPM